jgi:hypothetical protein
MNKITVKPNPDCKYCHGTGMTFDSVPYGMGHVQMPSTCDCVLEQLTEAQNELLDKGTMMVEFDLSAIANLTDDLD